MMETMLYALCGVISVSVVPLTLLPFYNAHNRILTATLLSLAVGCLLGDAIFHLLPEMLNVPFENANAPCIALISGLVLFLAFEQYLQLYHCGHGHGHGRAVEHEEESPEQHGTAMGPLVLFSDLMHNLVDGLAIGVSFRESLGTGLSSTMAVLLHEVPHELGDYAILGHSGYSRAKILQYSLTASLAAILGAIVGVLIGNLSILGQQLQPMLLGFTAGNFLYIALADLAPELMHSHSAAPLTMQNSLVLVGIITMYLSKLYLN